VVALMVKAIEGTAALVESGNRRDCEKVGIIARRRPEMRVGMFLGILCLSAVPVGAAPFTYPMSVDPDQSTLTFSLSLTSISYGVTVGDSDSSRVTGSGDFAIDYGASTIEVLSMNAGLSDGLDILLDATMYAWGWARLQTGSTDPLALQMVQSGGSTPFDEEGNFILPDVKCNVIGKGLASGSGTLGILLSLGLGLGVPPSDPWGPTPFDVTRLDASFTEDLPGVLGSGSGPKVTMPVELAGYDMITDDLRLDYSVVGQIVFIPEPVTLALLGLGGLGFCLRRRR